MAATATETKVRAPKAVAVTKLIGGKLVTKLAKSELDKLKRAATLCRDLESIVDWQDETSGAFEYLEKLIAKAS